MKTGRGEGESIDLATITRPPVMAAAEQVGLGLAEAKAPLAGPQASLVLTQLAEHATLDRVCPGCGAGHCQLARSIGVFDRAAVLREHSRLKVWSCQAARMASGLRWPFFSISHSAL